MPTESLVKSRMDSWSRVVNVLSIEVDPDNFRAWIEPIAYAGSRGDCMQLQVPNRHFKAWIEEHYMDRILAALRSKTHFSDVVFFTEDKEEQRRPIERAAMARAAEEDRGLNTRYTFENFVVGSCNQFAHAASMAVSKSPGHSYNPLFLYGGVGLGKTHLLNAIGNFIQRTSPEMQIIILSSESFMNEVINSIKNNRIPEFRKKFRSADVLLIDDIQYIAGKDRTTEEFFFTFNHLHERRKQIVISSDAPPKDIGGLEERVHSRFEWGLMADIRPPDIETKVAILRRKAALESVDLSDDIALFIASKVKSNIRELEGALTRLAAIASLRHADITLALAKEALRDIVNVEEKIITIELIQKVIAEEYGLKISELKSKNNARKVSFPRQVAMYLAKQLTDSSLPEIGKSFGGKHHSTVIHSINKIESFRKTDPEFNRKINSVIERFR